MGLNMHLTGEKYFFGRTERGQTKGKTVNLGYWRKHPNLHGYIVEEFADGLDDCEKIPLCVEQLEQIIAAVVGGELPETNGFYFGVSDGSETAEDLAILREALAWLQVDEPDVDRSVCYQASW